MLRALKVASESHAGERVDNAVIAFPCCVLTSFRRATHDAGSDLSFNLTTFDIPFRYFALQTDGYATITFLPADRYHQRGLSGMHDSRFGSKSGSKLVQELDGVAKISGRFLEAGAPPRAQYLYIDAYVLSSESDADSRVRNFFKEFLHLNEALDSTGGPGSNQDTTNGGTFDSLFAVPNTLAIRSAARRVPKK